MMSGKSIDQDTLDDWKERAVSFQLVDVRRTDERRARHIGGIHIPLDEIVQRRSEIRHGIPVVVYCRKGIRSQLAIQRLMQIDPDLDLYNLTGGIGQ
ncbi:MAG: rhodanese-like domain-containing protein [Saprospiraceae bacterium]|nr:rhodanese-like domain-containing protein [Saprospiraceae bacterium]